MKNYRLRYVLLIFFGLITWSSCSTSPTVENPKVGEGIDAEVDRYLVTRMLKRDIPGLSLAVLRDDEVVKLKGYGVANRRSKVAATEDTVYHLASLTKPFTATAVMLLVEDGKLSLDEKVVDVIPGLPAEWNGITLYHLLTHTSGLPDCLVLPKYQFMADTREKLIEAVAKLPLRCKPGEMAEYIQTDYVLLGAVIEKTSGKSFPEFMKRRLFEPLGMSRTSYGDETRKVPGRDQHYSRMAYDAERNLLTDGMGHFKMLQESLPYHHTYPAFTDPCAGLHTTVRDLAKWDMALSSGRLLKQSSLNLMWTATKGGETATGIPGVGFGCGWYASKTRDRFAHRIAVSTGGDACIYSRFLDDQLTVILLTNCQGAQPESIEADIAAMYLASLRRNQKKGTGRE